MEKLRGKGNLQALAKEKRKERKKREKREIQEIFSRFHLFFVKLFVVVIRYKLKENFEIILNCELEIITY